MRRAALGALAGILALLAAAPGARAADSVYWANIVAPYRISHANLNGSGGADLDTTGATLGEPFGVAIDAAAGRIWWANEGANKISFADLGGGGGGDLDTGAATVNHPEGIAVDPAAGRVYWANRYGGPSSTGAISFANLDGSGGGDFDTTGATVANPAGVAIDPAAGRIWWANNGADKISYTTLGGAGGGGDLNTTGATVSNPRGVAIAPASGRIYWANGTPANKISYAKRDGTGGGGDLDAGAAGVGDPTGVAIDPAAGRAWWASGTGGGTISFASLDGSGTGGDLNTTGATVDLPVFPALLRSPAPAGAPMIMGGAMTGATLACSDGSWAHDLLGSFLYRAPQTFAYRWTRDGAAIAGANTRSITASSSGNYRCTVTAQNHAGSTSQTSAAAHVSAPPDTKVTIKIKGKRVKVRKRRASVKLACPASEASPPCSGKLALKTAKKVPFRGHRRRLALAKASFKVGAGETKKVRLKLAKPKARLVAHHRKARKVKAIARVHDAAGNHARKVKRMKLKVAK